MDRYDMFLEALYRESGRDPKKRVDASAVSTALGFDESISSGIINLLLSMDQIAGPFEDGCICITWKGIHAVGRRRHRESKRMLSQPEG